MQMILAEAEILLIITTTIAANVENATGLKEQYGLWQQSPALQL
jgi:hypothetical protein